METVSPSNCQLYFGGHLEVPACGPCGPNGCNVPYGVQGGCYGVPTEGSVIASDGSGEQIDAPAGVPIEAEGLTPLPNGSEGTVPADQSSPGAAGDSSAATQSIPDPGAVKTQGPWSRNQVPAEFSRDNVSQSISRPKTATTTTPGLIGPLGYDIE